MKAPIAEYLGRHEIQTSCPGLEKRRNEIQNRAPEVRLEAVLVPNLNDGEQKSADNEWHQKPHCPRSEELTWFSALEGDPTHSTRDEKEQRYPPGGEQPEEHQSDDAACLRVLDMPFDIPERMHGVDDEDTDDCEHAKPVEVVEPLGPFYRDGINCAIFRTWA